MDITRNLEIHILKNPWLKKDINIFRSNCAAVIVGDTIVVMGGYSGDYSHWRRVTIKTAEYLVLGEDTWKELPPMHFERAGATACLLP